MRSHLRRLWRWSFVVTLPVTIVFVYWGWMTWRYYSTFGIRYDPYPAQVELTRAGAAQFRYMMRGLELAVTHPGGSRPTRDRIPVLGLYIPEANLAKLDENLPHSGFEYVEASMLIDGDVAKVDVRYRGDSIVHWASPKKSLRIKTKKQKLFEGMRKFNLMAPKSRFIAENHLSYELARSLGLIAPRSQMVDVVVNGELRGIHVMVEQLEELTLREHGLMPGDIYAGELFGKDAYAGVSAHVFEHPGLWEKLAENNHFDLDSRAPLERLIGLLDQEPSPRVDAALEEILDVEAWARFSAFETLAQSAHCDLVHNWRIYYDPWRCKLVPIVWDPIGWIARSSFDQPVALDLCRTKLHAALYRNSAILRAKHDVIARFYASGEDQRFLRRVDELVASLEPSIETDPYLEESTAEAKASLATYRERIQSTLGKVRVGFLEDESPILYRPLPSSDGRIALEIHGRRPLRSVTAVYRHLIPVPVSADVSYWVDGTKHTIDVSGAVSIRGNRARLDVPMRAAYVPRFRDDIRLPVQDIEPAYYEIELTGLGAGAELMQLEVDRGGSPLEAATRTDRIESRAFLETYNVVRPEPRAAYTTWSGDVAVSGVQHVFDDVILEPGTVVRLSQDASIIFHGRVVAQGTADKPILFQPAADGQDPWGTVAISGAGANGSVLAHCDFAEGSGYKDAGGMFEYSAMLSIHDVQGVKIDHCNFRDSQRVDDMVHTVYSDVVIENSTFSRAPFDALDVDIGTAVLRNNRFEDSGNDAIDLMTSDAVLVHSTILRSGDKAVSVGEHSRLLGIDSRFEGNVIGVQSKDSSIATLVNVDLVANALALDAYEKEWRYVSGGTTYVYLSRLLRNETAATADDDSSIHIDDCSHDEPIVDERVVVDRASSSGDARAAAGGRLRRHPEEIERMHGFSAEWWELVDPTVRGASEAEH